MDKDAFADIQLLANKASSWETSLMIYGVNLCPFLESYLLSNFQRNKLVNVCSSYQSPSKHTGIASIIVEMFKKDTTSSATGCGVLSNTCFFSPPTK